MDSVCHQIDFIAVENSDLVFRVPKCTCFPRYHMISSENNLPVFQYVCLSVLGDGGRGSVRFEYWCKETKWEKRDDILQSFTQFPCLNAVEPSLHLGLL